MWRPSWDKLVMMREQCRPNDGFLFQLQLFVDMGNRVDLDCSMYIYFALQHGIVKLVDVHDNGGDIKFKCKKCRKFLPLGRHVLLHRDGHFPDWWRDEVVGGECRQGVFIVPPTWLGNMDISNWRGLSRLDCYGCGAKIGGWGRHGVGVGRRVGVGSCSTLVKLTRVDRENILDSFYFIINSNSCLMDQSSLYPVCEKLCRLQGVEVLCWAEM